MGKSVALDGGKIVVGDHQWNYQKGRVVVLKPFTQIISNPDPYQPSRFGKRVAVHDGRDIVADGWGKVYFGVWE